MEILPLWYTSRVFGVFNFYFLVKGGLLLFLDFYAVWISSKNFFLLFVTFQPFSSSCLQSENPSILVDTPTVLFFNISLLNLSSPYQKPFLLFLQYSTFFNSVCSTDFTHLTNAFVTLAILNTLILLYDSKRL